MIFFTMIFAWLWNINREKLVGNSITKDENILKVKSYVYAVFTFLPMFLINSLMKNVGTDYGNYYTYFQRIVSGQEQEVDITYKWICLLVSRMGLEFQWVYVIYSLLSYTILLLCIKKYSKNYAISYLMFFLNGYFATLGLHQIRQFTAVVLILWAYSYIESEKMMKYFLCVGIASLFHFTALVMVPFYWILRKKWKLTTFFVLIVALLPLNLFYNQIMSWLFATFLPRYLNTNYTTRTFDVSVMFLGLILFPLIICMLYEKMSEENIIFKNCLYISAILVLCASWLPEYKRFVYYFFIPSIVYVPTLLESDKYKLRRWIFYILIIGYYSLYFLMTFDEWSIAPYQSILG